MQEHGAVSGPSLSTGDHAEDRAPAGNGPFRRRSPKEPGGSIRIEAANRSDAFELTRRLAGYQTHVVQLSDQRWVVCVRQDRDPDQLSAEILDEAARWVRERRIDTTMRLGDRLYALRP